MQVIRTASGVVSLGAYVKAWRAAKASAPGTEFKSSLCGFWPETRETILRQFAEGLHGRINRHLPEIPGRKASGDYQMRLRRDCRAVRDRVTRRVRVYQFETKEVRARFSHLLASRDDF